MRTALVAAVVVVVLVGVLCLECRANTGLLDGRVTVADSAGLNPSGAFTLEAWICPTTFHFFGWADNSYQTVIYKWAGGGQRSYLLDIFQDQLELAVSTTGEPDAEVYSNTRLTLNQWVHVAGVYDGATMALYINGQKDTATLPLVGSACPGDAPVYIGGNPNGQWIQRFHGGIDEVRISDVARYSAGFTTPTAEFAADSATMLLMHVNEGTGTFTDNVGLLGGDGTLDASSQWGQGAPITPEPATLSLLALGGLAATLRRKRHGEYRTRNSE